MQTKMDCSLTLLDGVRILSRGDEPGTLKAFAAALAGIFPPGLGTLCSARLRMLRRTFGEARALLERMTAPEPRTAEPWYFLGGVPREHYDTEAAARWFREALRRDPSDSRAAAGLGEITDAREP
jgi:hypothetical protein